MEYDIFKYVVTMCDGIEFFFDSIMEAMDFVDMMDEGTISTCTKDYFESR